MIMKVLHVINNLGSGGAEKLLEIYIPILNRIENIEVDILLLTDENNVFYDSLVKNNIKVLVAKYRSIYDIRNILEIRNHIVSGNYDIVHSHTFPTQYWVALASIIVFNKKVKFFTTEHSTHNRRREKIYLKCIEMLIYSQYDVIISITEKTKDNLIKWLNVNNKKIGKHFVIENGVNIEDLKMALPYEKKELIEGITNNIKLVCMVGRFSEAKDQSTLIKAISKLTDDYHLILVGEGPLIEEHKMQARILGIIERVHFLGFRQDIPRILKTVEVIVLSSHWEGLSIASIEGLSCGKPFIASRVPGLEELVDGYGLLFEHSNADELASLIYTVNNDKTLFDEVSKKCLQRAEDFNIRKTVNSLVKLYKDV